MNARAFLVRRQFRKIGVLAGQVLLAGAVAAIIYLLVEIVAAAVGGKFHPLRRVPVWGLALAAGIYLLGHGLRILRLALLIGGWRVGFRVIGSFHLTTAAVSLAVPLKLGEVYRVVELSNICGSFIRALVIVWWERAFDISVIFLMLMLALVNVSKTEVPEFAGIAGLAAIFIIVTAIVFFVLPDNLRRLSVFIIRRYDSPRTVRVLRSLNLIRSAVEEAPRVVRGKFASVATLTALIWMCEIACFAIVLAMMGGMPKSALSAQLAFLSAITRGETLPSVLDQVKGGPLSDVMLVYVATVQVPLALLGVVAAIYYIRWRLRQ